MSTIEYLEWAVDLPDPVLARLIECCTGIPATLADISAWRRAFARRLGVLRVRPRPAADDVSERERLGWPCALPALSGRRSERDLLLDFVTSMDFLALLAALTCVLDMVEISVTTFALALAQTSAERAVAAARRTYTLSAAAAGVQPAEIQRAHAYASALARGGADADDFWLARPLDREVLAALNGATATHLSTWLNLLAAASAARRRPDSREAVRAVLAELRAAGRTLLVAHAELDLGRPKLRPAAPAGLWPPPEPEPESADQPAGAAPIPAPR